MAWCPGQRQGPSGACLRSPGPRGSAWRCGADRRAAGFAARVPLLTPHLQARSAAGLGGGPHPGSGCSSASRPTARGAGGRGGSGPAPQGHPATALVEAVTSARWTILLGLLAVGGQVTGRDHAGRLAQVAPVLPQRGAFRSSPRCAGCCTACLRHRDLGCDLRQPLVESATRLRHRPGRRGRRRAGPRRRREGGSICPGGRWPACGSLDDRRGVLAQTKVALDRAGEALIKEPRWGTRPPSWPRRAIAESTSVVAPPTSTMTGRRCSLRFRDSSAIAAGVPPPENRGRGWHPNKRGSSPDAEAKRPWPITCSMKSQRISAWAAQALASPTWGVHRCRREAHGRTRPLPSSSRTRSRASRLPATTTGRAGRQGVRKSRRLDGTPPRRRRRRCRR